MRTSIKYRPGSPEPPTKLDGQALASCEAEGIGCTWPQAVEKRPSGHGLGARTTNAMFHDLLALLEPSSPAER